MRVKLEGVRIGFPRLFKAEQYKGQGAARYGAKFFVETGSTQHEKVIDAISTVAKEKFGKRAEAKLENFRGSKQQFPFIDGKRVDFDGAEDCWVLTANRKEDQGRPTVVDSDTSELLPQDGKPYAGCYVNAHVEFWAQDGDTPGIRCTLRGVQFVKDGDAFGGSRAASVDEFDQVAAEAEEALV